MRRFLADTVGKFIRKFGYFPGFERFIRFLAPSPVEAVISYSKSRMGLNIRFHHDWKLYYHGFYPANVSRFILDKLPDFLGKNPICFDIGAGIGNLSILLSEICGREAKIIAVECNPEALKRLNKQVELNNLWNKIVVINKAISEKNGMIYFHFPELNNFNYLNGYQLAEGGSNGIPVESVKFRSLLDNLKIEKVDFIRIDVQGFELNFFKDNKEILMKHKPVLSFMVDQNVYSRAGNSIYGAYDFLAGSGYKIYDYKLFLNKYLGRLKEVKRESARNYSDHLRIPDNWIAIHESRKT